MNDATTSDTTGEESLALTVEDLDIEELERRLELAASDAACQCWKYM